MGEELEIISQVTHGDIVGSIVMLLAIIILLFRDEKFLKFLTDIRQHRSRADNELIAELQREKDITKAFMEMVDDDELVIKYKTLQRVMRKHGSKKKDD